MKRNTLFNAFTSNCPDCDADPANLEGLLERIRPRAEGQDAQHLMIYIAGTGASGYQGITPRNGSDEAISTFVTDYGEVRQINKERSKSAQFLLEHYGQNDEIKTCLINGIPGNSKISKGIQQENQLPLLEVLQANKPTESLTIVTYSRGCFSVNCLDEAIARGLIPDDCEVSLILLEPALSKTIDPHECYNLNIPERVNKVLVIQSRGRPYVADTPGPNGWLTLDHPAMTVRPGTRLKIFDIDNRNHCRLPVTDPAVYSLGTALQTITGIQIQHPATADDLKKHEEGVLDPKVWVQHKHHHPHKDDALNLGHSDLLGGLFGRRPQEPVYLGDPVVTYGALRAQVEEFMRVQPRPVQPDPKDDFLNWGT